MIREDIDRAECNVLMYKMACTGTAILDALYPGRLWHLGDEEYRRLVASYDLDDDASKVVSDAVRFLAVLRMEGKLPV